MLYDILSLWMARDHVNGRRPHGKDVDRESISLGYKLVIGAN